MTKLSAIFGSVGVYPEVVVVDDFVGSKSLIFVFVAHVDEVFGFVDGDFCVVRRKLGI